MFWRSLCLLAAVAATSAQITGVCQPSFVGDNDGGAGRVFFDLVAGDIGYYVNDFLFVASEDIDEIEVSGVLVFNQSVFDRDDAESESFPVVSIVDEVEVPLTIQNVDEGETFALGLNAMFEVEPNSIVGFQITLQRSVIQYTELANADIDDAEDLELGDVARSWGALSSTTGSADDEENVIINGAVCFTSEGVGSQIVSIVNLTTAEVVPELEEESVATGTAIIRFDTTSLQLTYSVEFEDLSSDVTYVALHGPADIGEVAGVQLETDDLESPSEGTGIINSIQAELLLDGLWYVQIATTDNPIDSNLGGELRGQIVEFVDPFVPLSFPLTVDAVEEGLQDVFEEDIILSPQAEDVAGTPNAVESEGTGTAYIAFDGIDTLDYEITFTGLTGNATIAHFHSPANTTGTAGVEVDISRQIENDPDSPGDGEISATLTNLDSSQVQDILDGLWYINIHTEMNPAGEIRGQVNRVLATEINSAASGSVDMSLDQASGQLRYQIVYQGLSSSIESIELRGPALEMETSEVIQEVVVEGPNEALSGIFTGLVELDTDQVAAFQAGSYYLVVFTTNNPITGEIRGQAVDTALITLVEPQEFDTEVILSVDAELQALDPSSELVSDFVESNATGTAEVTYVPTADGGMVTWNIEFQNLTSDAILAHFHGPASTRTTAGVRVVLASEEFESPLVGSANITDDMAREMIAGLWYINIHTELNTPTGELRGQVVPVVLDVIETEAPEPAETVVVQQAMNIELSDEAEELGGTLLEVASNGSGVALVTLYSNNSISWEITVSDLTGDVVQSHFHGPATTEETAGVRLFITEVGGIFNTPHTGMSEEPLSDEFVQELLDGLWYINIHTELNPSGEIRGQVVDFEEIVVEIIEPEITEGPIEVDVEMAPASRSSFSLLAMAVLAAASSLYLH